MIEFSQYYTNSIYSKLLIEKIAVESPGVILDMGIGDGSLTKAAISRWADAQFLAIDLDKKNCDAMREYSPKIRIIQEDGLKSNLNKKLKIKVGSVDVAICNPPYEKIKIEKYHESIFKSANLNSCINNKNITSDIIFLANNLSLLKNNGYLGIILPDGLLTRADLYSLRADLINNHTLKYIIQLPDNIFNKTEARTHILILTKGKSNYSKVKLLLSNSLGEYIDSIEVPKESLIQRMDFTFQKWNMIKKNKGKTLAEINVEIVRGSYSHKELKELDLDYFHTTDFKGSNIISFKNNKYNLIGKNIAIKGDILMARVGKRCVGRLAYIQEGNILISDCIYRIRVPREFRKMVWTILNSSYGYEWINVYAHGVCAQVISKKDLLNFPLCQ